MTFQYPSALSLVGFLSVVLGVMSCFTIGVYFASKKLGHKVAVKRTVLFGLGLSSWLLLVTWVVASGVLDVSPMPRVMLYFGVCNLVAAIVALSPIGGWLASGLPIAWIVGFQSFRIPLELVLHSWAEQGTIPPTMTWSGSNFDIFSGIVALAVIPFLRKRPQFAWIANLVGLALLINVGRVAILSSPLPFSWNVTPPLLLAMYVPYTWIGPICVGGALAGHLILTRALLRNKNRIS